MHHTIKYTTRLAMLIVKHGRHSEEFRVRIGGNSNVVSPGTGPLQRGPALMELEIVIIP